MRYVFLLVAVVIACGPPPPPAFKGLGAWSASVAATPVMVISDPTTPQPDGVRGVAEPYVDSTDSGVAVFAMCPMASPIHLEVDSPTRAHYRGPPFVCVRGVVPAFRGATETWDTCEDVTVEVHTLSLEHRSGDIMYGEGGATLTGCGRVWTSVLVQIQAKRRLIGGHTQ